MSSAVWDRRVTLLSGGALIGVLVAIAVAGANDLKVDATVTFGNVLQAGTTLLVAVIVASHLRRQAASDRKEKDVVLRHVDFAIDSIAELEESHHSGDLTAINASLKKLAANCTAANDLCTDLKYQEGLASQAGVPDLIRQIRELSTATPRDAADTDPKRVGASVANNVITFTPPRAALLETRVHQLRMRLLRAQVAINKSHRSDE